MLHLDVPRSRKDVSTARYRLLDVLTGALKSEFLLEQLYSRCNLGVILRTAGIKFFGEDLAPPGYRESLAQFI